MLTLERIRDGLSEALRREVINLVDEKFLVDGIARRHGSRLAQGLHDGAYGPKEGNPFFRAVLPFSNRSPVDEAFPAMVPTSQTIGCSWKWWPDNLKDHQIESYRAFFLDAVRADGGANRAEYDWIQPLGLFLAVEGKNRVALMRELKEEWFPARVTPCTYPAANRIAIYRQKIASDECFWAVLDDKLAEPLDHPSWAMPLLLTYGVMVRESWPERFPAPDTVREAWRHAKECNNGARPDRLDLAELRRRDDLLAEVVKCPIKDIEELRLDWRIHVGSLLTGLIALGVMDLLPARWTEIRCAAAMFGGFMLAVAALPFLKIVSMPRRHLNRSGA